MIEQGARGSRITQRQVSLFRVNLDALVLYSFYARFLLSRLVESSFGSSMYTNDGRKIACHFKLSELCSIVILYYI